MDFPPQTPSVYMESYMPKNQRFLNQSESVNYFQDYRNETLSRFSMPTYEWGFTRPPYSPKGDLVGAYRKANWKKLLEPPKVKLRLIDDARSQEVDDFYKLCQMHRDQYRDNTGRLHPLLYFRSDVDCKSPCKAKPAWGFPAKMDEYEQPLMMKRSNAQTRQCPMLSKRCGW